MKIGNILTNCMLAGLLCVSFSAIANESEGFPGREKFPDIPYIEKHDLYKNRSNYVIVDARSNYEFKTLRISNSINIPVADKTFESRVEKLSKTSNKPIVFYCNGRRCMKSYIAAKKAMEYGISNVISFDAGIFEWTKAYPNQAILLGQSPVDPRKLIAKKIFNSHLLSPDKFSEYVVNNLDNSMVIDVRDKFQRAAVGFYPGIERWAALDNQKSLNRYIQKAKRDNKTLFIYDEVGKQVRWLQYALEKAGIKKYYFMKKGARAYYDRLAQLEWDNK